MIRNHARRAILTLSVLSALAAPATASAYTVTVHVHGAGLVDEVTDRNLMFCTVGPSGKSESSVTPCNAGDPAGAYHAFDIIQLRALVPAGHFAKGWRFSHWQDSTAGGGKINCDETGGPGEPPDTDCRFQIFQNLEVDLYFTDDAGPEDTAISGGPGEGSRTNTTSASFDFNSPSESLDARYECRLDPPGAATGDWVECGNPDDKSVSYPGLTDGQYTLSVRAKDPTGNVDPTPATRTWTVDTSAPTVNITGNPSQGAVTNDRSANLTATTEAGATLFCAFEGIASSCSINRANLPDGQYTFSAQATDAAGNVGPSATRTWTIDTDPPTVNITGNPSHGAVTDNTAASLTAITEPGATLACAFQGTSSPCSIDRADLPDGDYTFSAQATDAAGNVGPSAARTWTVDAVAPTVELTAGPSEGSTVNASTATFSWTAGEPATFTCSLGDAPFTACTSGDELGALSEGPNRFRLRATATGGRKLETTIERTWTVDTAVPDTTLLKGPAESSTSASSEAAFEFASPESGATFECRLDGAAFAACTSPLKLTGLTNDDHVFEVRARDAAGNVDATPARRAWRVNTLDADADGVNSPADCNDGDPAVKPGATDVPGDGVDQDCAGGDAAVVTPPVDDDKDDDGVSAALDCDDANPAVRPGAVDLPKDGVDQDCKGGDAAFPVTSGALDYNFKPVGRRTRILRMVLSKVAVGATVRITCKGRGCPVRSKRFNPSKGTLDVRRALKRKPLRAGNVLTLSITQPGHVAKVIRFKARRGKSPRPATFRCLEPGAKKLTACP